MWAANGSQSFSCIEPFLTPWRVGCTLKEAEDAMLDPWIIDEIRRREEEERRQQERPAIELPLEAPYHPATTPQGKPEEKEERGVVIVDFSI
jgi:hypothetical protein